MGEEARGERWTLLWGGLLEVLDSFQGKNRENEGWVGEEALGERWTLLWGGLLEVLDTFQGKNLEKQKTRTKH